MSEHSSDVIRTTLLADFISELVQDATDAYEARQTGKPRGPMTGIPAVDEAIGGFMAPGIHQLQAAPGAGKTAFCLQTAASCGFPCLYVTAEMPPKMLWRRVISRCTNTFLGKLSEGELLPDQIRALAIAAAKRVPQLAVMDSTIGFASPGEHILPMAEELRNKFQSKTVLIVIDALQAWAKGVGSGETEYELVNAGLLAARGLAARLSCPVLCISHRNRMGQKAGGLHAGKGSGDLEYAAESVIELTPGPKKFDRLHVREVMLGIHKNRHGEADVEIELEFEGRLQAFRTSDGAAPSAGYMERDSVGFDLMTPRNGRGGR